MNASMWWGGLLRLTEAFLASSPFVLTGLVVAGVFRRLLGRTETRRLFGDGTWRELPQAWAIGMLLPVCSLGVIPVCREMCKAGLSGGTILAFALAAPLFNPLSLLYGLTLSRPIVIFSFALCSLVVITAVGLIWDRIFPRTASPPEASAPVPAGIRRLLAVGVHAARESAGASALYVAAGLLGVAAMSFFLPAGSLQRSANADNPWAPLVMTAVAVPAYATPMLAMGQLGSMFQHGNSIGAAFALLALGAGMNLGLAAWMFANYGAKRSLAWFALLVAVVVGLSYGVQSPLQTTTATASDHTHAFDVYCSPFHGDEAAPGAFVRARLARDVQPYEWYGAALLGAFVLIGLVLRFADPQQRTEAWLERPRPVPETDAAGRAVPAVGRFDVTLSPAVLGTVALLAVVAASIACCYVYYPAQGEVLDELRIWHVEAVSAAAERDEENAEHLIAVTDDWSRKLEVGTFLREWRLSEYLQAKGAVFRFKLELLKHEVEDGTPEEIAAARLDVARAYSRLRTAYQAPR